MNEPLPQLAAIDLGSNSFHMIVARSDGSGGFTVLDRIKDPVRLAAGIDQKNRLTAPAMSRALACLARFSERIDGLPGDNVRVVGTNTLRRAKNGPDFVELAAEALGHRIEIISGREEARLIFAGVNQAFDAAGRRLVIDIGGGSTELILGTAAGPDRLDSAFMGCVTWSERFFPDGRIKRKQMERAINAARQRIGGVMRGYRQDGWDHALGASGTIKALSATLAARGDTTDGITREALEKLAAEMSDLKHIDRVNLPEVPEHRKPVLAGGLAILLALFRSLRIWRMQWVSGALKEGLLLRIIGEMEHREDLRNATVRALAERLQIDEPHAARVRETARGLLAQAADTWHLTEEHGALLLWAAELHEVGQFMSYTSYHKHGAYLLANADLAGFARQEQRALAAMVLCHRGKLNWQRIRTYVPGASRILLRMIILLRIAASIHRTRSPNPPPPIQLTASKSRLSLRYPDGWLENKPLTRADLKDMAAALGQVGYTLSYR